MHDVSCSICAEPWDSYGVNHGDMTPGEAAAFHRGEGCPVCRYGTKAHKRNTHPRPGILALRAQQAATEQAHHHAVPVVANEAESPSLVVPEGHQKCGWCFTAYPVEHLHVIGFQPRETDDKVLICEKCLDKKRQQ